MSWREVNVRSCVGLGWVGLGERGAGEGTDCWPQSSGQPENFRIPVQVKPQVFYLQFLSYKK